MIIRLFKKINDKLNPYKTVDASELVKNREVPRSNIPGSYLLDGISHQHLMRNDSQYQAKVFRKENGYALPLDKLEDEILSHTRKIIYDYFNHPYYVIPILMEDENYRKSIEKLNKLINNYLKVSDKKEFEYNPITKYKKYKPSGMHLTSMHKHSINELISILENKKSEIEELFEYEIYNNVYQKMKSLNYSISNIMIQNDERIQERIDFYHDY